MSLTEKMVKKAAAAAGLTEVGVTSAAPLDYMRSRLNKRVAENRVSPFETKEVERRLSPALLLENCQAVVMIALPLEAPKHTLSDIMPGPKGLVARCARTLDYHELVRTKARALVDHLKKMAAISFSYRIYCDQSPLLERELSFNSGLGFIGKNCTLINKKYGSQVVLGSILLDQKVHSDAAISQKSCLDCRLCLEACPTGALLEPYIIDPFRCLSYLTQAAGIFPRQMRPLLKNRIYGCDHCQDVCPYNKERDFSPYKESHFEYFAATPLLLPLLSMTRKEFDSTIGLTSAGWRGKTTLQRNAVIALGNSGFNEATGPLIRLLKTDKRAVIRQHAAWALGQLGGSKARQALEQARHKDPDPGVQEEALLALTEGI